MNTIRHDNIFYVRDIHPIGGVETYLYELVKKYKDNDIAVVCKSVDPEQYERLTKYCRVYRHKKETIECKVAIINWDTSIIDYITKDIWKENAKDGEGIYQTIHADYTHESQGTPPHDPRIKYYLAITEDILKNYKKLINAENIKLCRNPLSIEKKEKYLILVSPTRLTPEKGGKMMLALANTLDRLGIKFIWFVITISDYLSNPIFNNKNVVYVKNRLDISPYYAIADWVVVPSETEGDSYTMKEAVYRGVPLVVRHLPYFDEIGIKDNENALFITEDNIEEVAKKMLTPLKFEFKPVVDGYDEIIKKGDSHFEEDLKMKYRVKAIYNFQDLEAKVLRKSGDEFEVNQIRLDVLLGNNADKKVWVEVLGEIETPEEEPKPKKKTTKKVDDKNGK